MKKIIFIMLLFLGLISCNKDRTFHIKAINPVTGQPYSGLEYTIKATKTGANGENVVYEKSGVLDANGEAYVTVKVKGNRTYNIGCKEPPNTCYTKDIHFTYAIQDEPSPTFQFEYAECAYLKLSINNVNCQGSGDNFKLYHEGSDVKFISEISGTPIKQGDGCYNYLGSSFSDVPMGRRWYRWEVTRNSITTIFHDTIYLTPGEYRTYEINY